MKLSVQPLLLGSEPRENRKGKVARWDRYDPPSPYLCRPPTVSLHPIIDLARRTLFFVFRTFQRTQYTFRDAAKKHFITSRIELIPVQDVDNAQFRMSFLSVSLSLSPLFLYHSLSSIIASKDTIFCLLYSIRSTDLFRVTRIYRLFRKGWLTVCVRVLCVVISELSFGRTYVL